MICLITTVGYLGKYSLNLLLDYILISVYGDENGDYDKRIFLYYILGLYAVSIIFSILFYLLFKLCIFEYDTNNEKGENNNKIVSICQICGYIIYSEKKKPKIPPSKNCCRLCCESFQNCCNETFCYYLGILGCDDCCCICECCCCGYCDLCSCCECCECCECCDYCNCCARCECCECCKCCECCEYYDCCECYDNCKAWFKQPICYCSVCKECKYDPKDYGKKEESFLYCYKTERKSLWCNKFVTNETQKKIFPYMLEYFVLQLTTIGFEKQYEKYKDLNTHRKTFIAIFISTFILFFYFTLSFTRYLLNDDEDSSNNGEDKGKENDKKNLKGAVSKISNEILNGTHGILLFNSVFSIIFSIFYLSNMSEDIKSFLFKDNINIIFMPILMNKFFYFFLTYYCVYTGEEEKKFEIISGSSLISFYIIIWNLAMTLIKSSIPEENNDYDYYNILYIIQIVFSSLPSLLVAIFLLSFFCLSTGICNYLDGCDDITLICYNFKLHKFLFFILSFLFCFGGLWIKVVNLQEFEYEYECCYVGNCCDIGDNCFPVYCIDNVIYCDCCCCDKNSVCYSKCCYMNCDKCRICRCCENN